MGWDHLIFTLPSNLWILWTSLSFLPGKHQHWRVIIFFPCPRMVCFLADERTGREVGEEWALENSSQTMWNYWFKTAPLSAHHCALSSPVAPEQGLLIPVMLLSLFWASSISWGSSCRHPACQTPLLCLLQGTWWCLSGPVHCPPVCKH